MASSKTVVLPEYLYAISKTFTRTELEHGCLPKYLLATKAIIEALTEYIFPIRKTLFETAVRV